VLFFPVMPSVVLLASGRLFDFEIRVGNSNSQFVMNTNITNNVSRQSLLSACPPLNHCQACSRSSAPLSDRWLTARSHCGRGVCQMSWCILPAVRGGKSCMFWSHCQAMPCIPMAPDAGPVREQLWCTRRSRQLSVPPDAEGALRVHPGAQNPKPSTQDPNP
jgi:hypothetical protein